MNSITIKPKNDSLDYLKAFAITLVVTHHAITYTNMVSLHPFVLTFLDLITSVHVPLFFCIAGYLCHEQDFKKFYSKKFERILIPFITFSMLKLLYTQFISNAHAHAATFKEQFIDAFAYGTLYWFIYPMLLFYLIAPILWKHKRANIVIFVLLILINIYIGDPTFLVFQIGAAFYNACFFVGGILIQQYEKDLSNIAKKYNTSIFVVCSIIVAVITYFLYIRQIAFCFPVQVTLAFPLMYIAWTLAKKLPKNIHLLKTMGKYSLQIMFFDSFFKVLLFAILTKLNLVSVATSLFTIPVNISLCCISCIIIQKIPFIRKFFGL